MKQRRSAEKNPFRVSQLESLDWIPSPMSLDEIFQKWASYNFKGQLVGNHGAGKTTLAHLLKDKLEEGGRSCEYLFTSKTDRNFSSWNTTVSQKSKDTIFIFDGIGHASYLKRRKWLRETSCFMALVHKPLKNLPIICTLIPDTHVFEKLCEKLAGKEGLELLEASGGSQAMLKDNNYNMRDCLFNLYAAWSRLSDCVYTKTIKR